MRKLAFLCVALLIGVVAFIAAPVVVSNAPTGFCGMISIFPPRGACVYWTVPAHESASCFSFGYGFSEWNAQLNLPNPPIPPNLTAPYHFGCPSKGVGTLQDSPASQTVNGYWTLTRTVTESNQTYAKSWTVSYCADC